jgi:hypothetical protein
MASTYSSLKIQLMATGENSGTWGNVTNVNLGTALEEAIVGSEDVTFSSGTVTLTLSNTNASQTARNLRLNLTGTSGGAQNLIVPAIEKVYIINNGCADTITVKNSTGSGVAVPTGKTMYVYNTGTNVVDAITHLTSLTLATALPISSGGTGSISTTYANLQSNVSGVLPVANGGTGSGTATFSGANITSLNASSISSGTLAVANGGTGATVAATALSNLGGVTQAGARSALSFAAGSGAYDSSTGVITIPTNNNQITNGAGYTTNAGTVTSVSGTGTASGLTLSGTVTNSGSLTLSGTVNSLAGGTYGINISGNAATATSATSATTAGSVTGLSMGSSTMTVSGSAPAQPIRAFVNINKPFGTVNALQSFNVSSVGYVATGQFTINYTTALPNIGVMSTSSPVVNANGTGQDVYKFGGGTTTFSEVFMYERGALTPAANTVGSLGVSIVCQ